MIGRIVKRLLRRLIRLLIVGRWVALGCLALLLIGGAVGTTQGFFQVDQLPGLSISLPGPKRAPDSTENDLKGQQTYNAELVWSTLSDEALERYRARGVTMADQQRQLDLARDKGTKLEQINYVGGQSLPDGTSLQFYVVAARGPIARSDLEYVTYIFTLDRSGKIARVQ